MNNPLSSVQRFASVLTKFEKTILVVSVAATILSITAAFSVVGEQNAKWNEAKRNNPKFIVAISSYRDCRGILFGALNHKPECAQSAYNYAESQNNELGKADKNDFFKLIEQIESQ